MRRSQLRQTGIRDALTVGLARQANKRQLRHITKRLSLASRTSGTLVYRATGKAEVGHFVSRYMLADPIEM